jgi:hypothetical protein
MIGYPRLRTADRGGTLTGFGNEEPIEDALDQRIYVDDSGQEADPFDRTDRADWEASEADVAEQQLEVPEPADDDRG